MGGGECGGAGGNRREQAARAGGSAAARAGARRRGHVPQKAAKRLSPAAKEKDGARSVLFLCVGHARQPLTVRDNVFW